MGVYLSGLFVIVLGVWVFAWWWAKRHGLPWPPKPLMCGMALSFIALVLYGVWGAPGALHKTFVLQARADAMQAAWAQDGGVTVLRRLEAYVAAHPDDHQAAALLKRLKQRQP